MTRPSEKMRIFGAETERVAVRLLNRCQHPQAEPVLLSTGETVACVCIGCFQRLDANWIVDQRHRAEVAAYCAHEDSIEITAFGQADRRYTCTGCGSWLSDGTWPTIHQSEGVEW